MPRRSALIVAAALLLPGCATYQPKPLDILAKPAQSPAWATPPAGASPSFSLEQIGQMAVHSNPDLMAARTEHGIAQAQLESAAALPNPMLSASYAGVVGGPGALPAIALGLGQDIKALIIRPAKVGAAKAQLAQVDAGILWQEWQVSAKAELTALELATARRQLALATETSKLWDEQLARSRTALDRGDISMIAFVKDSQRMSDARQQTSVLATLALTKQQELAGLLGLSSGIDIPVSYPAPIATTDPALVSGRIEDLTGYRPDLIALQAGYESQEQKVRQSVLAQFPAMTIGGNYGRDTGNVKTAGLDVSMELPIFNHNQAGISVELATRDKLAAEFRARLIAAKNELTSLVAQQALSDGQRVQKAAQLAADSALVPRLRAALARNDVDALTYVEAVAAQNAKEQELIGLESNIAAQNLAIQTLSGLGMPYMASPDAVPARSPIGANP